MKPKFAHGDRVMISDANVARRISSDTRTGAILQSGASEGTEETYQVMFDGEKLPEWVSGKSLQLIE